jgi:hypothetical protein
VKDDLSKNSLLSDPQVAHKLVELMRTAAESVPPQVMIERSKTTTTEPLAKALGTRMNKKQKIILVAVIVVVVGMLVFPPFHVTLLTGTVENLGYGLIFSPPSFDYLFRGNSGLTGFLCQ